MYKTVTLSIVVFCSVNILVNPNIQTFFFIVNNLIITSYKFMKYRQILYEIYCTYPNILKIFIFFHFGRRFERIFMYKFYKVSQMMRGFFFLESFLLEIFTKEVFQFFPFWQRIWTFYVSQSETERYIVCVICNCNSFHSRIFSDYTLIEDVHLLL